MTIEPYDDELPPLPDLGDRDRDRVMSPQEFAYGVLQMGYLFGILKNDGGRVVVIPDFLTRGNMGRVVNDPDLIALEREVLMGTADEEDRVFFLMSWLDVMRAHASDPCVTALRETLVYVARCYCLPTEVALGLVGVYRYDQRRLSP